MALILLLAAFGVRIYRGTVERDTVNTPVSGENGASMEQANRGEAETLTAEQSSLKQSESKLEGNAELSNLSAEYKVILTESKRDFYAKYPIDETFLMWVNAEHGDDVIKSLSAAVESGQNDVSLWLQYTGKSIHVLWLEFCREWKYSSYLLEPVTWVECRDAESVTMDFIGDINFDETWDTTVALDERGGKLENCIAPELIQELQSADITMANNEFTYSLRGTALEGKQCVFRANPERVNYLKEMGVDIVSLANNHTYDYGEDALLDTMDTLRQAWIPYVGAGNNLDEAKKIQYFIANGRKIAIVSATQIERYYKYTKEATATTAGVMKTLDPAIFVSVIKEAKAHSDYVIAYVHWGSEGLLYQDEDQKELARQFVAAGVDVIIGGHSHRLQGVGYVEGVPILYSLGNFWFSTGDIYTTIAKVIIQKDGTLSIGMLPCRQENLTTSLISDEQGIKEFYQYIADISEYVAIDEDGIFYFAEDTETAKTIFPYVSGQHYMQRTGAFDLDGTRINIIGNIVE